MASLYDLKPAFQDRLRPLVERLAGEGVTANTVTVAAIVLSVIAGAMVAFGGRWACFLLPPVLFARMALNAMDGMLAREHGQKTRFGALLNEVGDVASDLVLYLPLAAAATPPELAAMIALGTGIGLVTEVAGLAALMVGSERRYDGPMGKSDRAFWFGAIALALGLGLPEAWIFVVSLLVAGLGIWTIARRIGKALEAGA